MKTKTKTKKKMGDATKTSKASASAREKMMAKAKAALDKSKQRSAGGEGGNKWLKIENDTKVMVRVLPTWQSDPDELFYKEFVKHYGLGPDGKAQATCLGENCPICRHVNREKDKLKKKLGKEAFKSKAWAALNRIGPKTKNLFNVVVLKRIKSKKNPGKFITKVESNSGKPFVYEAPASVMQEILTYFLDDTGEWGVFYDKDTRYDFIITKTKTGPKDMDVEYSVMPTKGAAKFSTDEFLDKMNDLDAEATANYSEEDMERLLRGEAVDKGGDDDAPKKSSKPGKGDVKVKLKNRKAVEEEPEVEEEAPKIKKKKSAIEDELRAAKDGKTKKKIKVKTK